MIPQIEVTYSYSQSLTLFKIHARVLKTLLFLKFNLGLGHENNLCDICETLSIKTIIYILKVINC